MGYNHTHLPNLLGHENQEIAGHEVHPYYPLIKSKACPKHMKPLICSVYAPSCTILDTPVMPCKSLCEAARNECEAIMNKFGFTWPNELNCSKFPSKSEDQLCIRDIKDISRAKTIGSSALSVTTQGQNSLSPKRPIVKDNGGSNCINPQVFINPNKTWGRD